jgi:hypothetical protein
LVFLSVKVNASGRRDGPISAVGDQDLLFLKISANYFQTDQPDC